MASTGPVDIPAAELSWRHLQQLESSTSDNPHALDDDARSMHSMASRISQAGSSYSAATFYSFSTSNYSGFSGAGELARRAQQKRRHYVHPHDLDPTACYDVDWVQDDLAMSCMACYAEFSPLLRRKHHCRACGRVVCSGCSRARVQVVGLRGLQKACNDCVAEAEKLRGCESISEDPEASRGEDREEEMEEADALVSSSITNAVGGRGCCNAVGEGAERKVEGDKEEGEPGARDWAAKEAEAFPGEPQRESFSSKKQRERKSAAATVGILAVGCTALAVGSVLVLNPKLLSTVLSRLGRR